MRPGLYPVLNSPQPSAVLAVRSVRGSRTANYARPAGRNRRATGRTFARRGIGGGRNWLLKLLLRYGRKLLHKPRNSGDGRNHGFKGVKKRGRTGLSGR